MAPAELFAGTYARGAAARAFSAQAWLDAMVEVEDALTLVCAQEGLISEADCAAVRAALARGGFDLAAIAAEAGNHATPVVPLVAMLRERVGPEHAHAVHCGATSQDIVDTAMMLLARRALQAILADARTAAAAAARLADRHRDTPVAGRTLLQQALPTSFGLVAAGWLAAIGAAGEELERAAAQAPAVQAGGPVGKRSPRVAARLAATLNLAEPPLPWQTDRTRIARLAGTAGTLTGAFAKVARDVSLMAQSELGELREGAAGRGGSSAMAHKRNPVAAVSVIACARRVPGLVATLLTAMEQELQRAAGAWQAEWGTLAELLTLTGSATAWAADLLGNLEVDTARMRANLAQMAAAGVAEAAEPEQHLDGAGELIDRALAGRWA